MIYRFWCPTHKKAHFLTEMSDYLINAACLEMGNNDCEDFKYIERIELHV